MTGKRFELNLLTIKHIQSYTQSSKQFYDMSYVLKYLDVNVGTPGQTIQTLPETMIFVPPNGHQHARFVAIERLRK